MSLYGVIGYHVTLKLCLKWVLKHQDLQMFGLKLGKYE